MKTLFNNLWQHLKGCIIRFKKKMFQHKLKTKTDGILNFTDYKKRRFRVVYLIMIVILLLAIVITVFPPLWLLLAGFKEPSELFTTHFTMFPKHFDLGKVIEVWQKLKVSKYYINSIALVAGSVACAVLFNGLLAYVVSVLKPKGHQMIYFIVLASLMVPAVTNMKTLFNNITEVGLINSYLPLWLSYGANPFYFVMFKTYFDHLPKDLFEAAEIDGANRLQMFFKVTLPLSLPMVMVVAIFATNASWSDFLLPYLVLQDKNMVPLMVRIFVLNGQLIPGITKNDILMMITLSIIPVLILFSIFQKQITSNVTSSGIKG